MRERKAQGKSLPDWPEKYPDQPGYIFRAHGEWVCYPGSELYFATMTAQVSTLTKTIPPHHVRTHHKRHTGRAPSVNHTFCWVTNEYSLPPLDIVADYSSEFQSS